MRLYRTWSGISGPRQERQGHTCFPTCFVPGNQETMVLTAGPIYEVS